MGQERLGPFYFFISLVLGPLNSLLWYVPSSRYMWSSRSYFLVLQEQIKDIIITITPPRYENQTPPPPVGRCSSSLGLGMGGQRRPQADTESQTHPRHSVTA